MYVTSVTLVNIIYKGILFILFIYIIYIIYMYKIYYQDFANKMTMINKSKEKMENGKMQKVQELVKEKEWKMLAKKQNLKNN